jgi:hypothetical protein
MLGFGRQSQPYLVVNASHGDVMAKPSAYRKVNRPLSSSCHMTIGLAPAVSGLKMVRQYLHFAGRGYIC